MMTDHLNPGRPGIAEVTHLRWCRLLGLDPVGDLPIERAGQLPDWCCEELIATPAALQKLSTWARATPRDTWESTPDDTKVRLAMHCTGDLTLYLMLAELLCELPAPVRDYALTRTTFNCIGLDSRGACGPRFDFGDRPWFVELSACHEHDTRDSIRAIMAEEIAHSFLNPEPAPGVFASGSLFSSAILGMRIEDIPADFRERAIASRSQIQRDETLAAALMARWGFTKVVPRNYAELTWAAK